MKDSRTETSCFHCRSTEGEIVHRSRGSHISALGRGSCRRFLGRALVPPRLGQDAVVVLPFGRHPGERSGVVDGRG
jgi:hypothetical protein